MKVIRILVVLALVTTVALFSGCQNKKKLGANPNAGVRSEDANNLLPPGVGNEDLTGSTPLGGALGPRTGGTFVPAKEIGNDGRWQDVVYFAFDRYDIGDAEKGKLAALAKYLEGNASYCVQIEGHCDTRGSDEYNRGLSERRAIAIRDYLVSLGVADTRLETIGYGEEKPAVATAASEADHAQNRRGEFVIGTRQ